MPAPPPKVLFQAAIREWPLRPVAKLVGWSLSTYMGNDGRAWPSLAAVAHGACCSESTARRVLRELAEIELLQIERSRGRLPNRYAVNPAAAAAGFNPVTKVAGLNPVIRVAGLTEQPCQPEGSTLSELTTVNPVT